MNVKLSLTLTELGGITVPPDKVDLRALELLESLVITIMWRLLVLLATMQSIVPKKKFSHSLEVYPCDRLI